MLIVGDAPTRTDADRGMPLSSSGGTLVNKALGETGVDRDTVWRTYAIACLPTQGASEETKDLAAHACRGRLIAELLTFPRAPILTLGNVAAQSLLAGYTDLPTTQITGTHFDVDLGDGISRSIIPTVHPASILKTEGANNEKTGGHVADLAYWSLKWDVLKVKAIARGDDDIRLPIEPGVDIFVEIVDAERARDLVWERICKARETGRITIDYETYVDDDQRNFALQAFIAKIKLLSLSSGGVSCCVAWNLLDAPMIREYGNVLADESITKAWHNGCEYDAAVSKNYWHQFDIRGPQEDTLLMQHAAWPGAPKRLQHVVSQFFLIPPWKSDYRSKGDSLLDEANYSALDVHATAAIVEPLQFWVKKTRTERVYDVDRIKAAFANQMHLRGYYVCPEVNSELKRRLSRVIDASNASMRERYNEIKSRVHERLCAEQAKTARKGDPSVYSERVTVRAAELEKAISKGKFEFSFSNDNHAAAFLKACGVNLWKTTPSGRIATGGDVLDKFSDHPEVDALLRLRENEQLLDTFVVRMFEWVQGSNGKWAAPHVQDDGRCHPLWSPTQISGRFSSRKPASSNWAEGDETNLDPRKQLPNVRRQLVAPPGRAIVAFDYEQLEARLMAVQSGDPFLCQIFRDGLDIHYEFAKPVFPRIELLTKKDPEFARLRNLTKRLEYGALYGGSLTTVYNSIAADEPTLAGADGRKMVEVAIAKMKGQVAGLMQWQRQLLASVSSPPYIMRSYVNGRMRIWPLGSPPPTDVANNPNQFAGADIIDNGLCRMLPRLAEFRDAFGILHQHDAIYFECDENDIYRLANAVKESFPTEITAADGKPIEFPIEVKAGFAYHAEPSDAMKAKYAQLIWPVGRPGLKTIS